MKVNTKQAIKIFFQNPSLDMVFKEAIANSLDAKATKMYEGEFIYEFLEELLVLYLNKNEPCNHK